MNLKVKSGPVLSAILIAILTVSFLTYSAFSARAQGLTPVKVFGMGEIGETFFNILLDDQLGTPMGTLMFSDHPNKETVLGEITAVNAVSSTEVNFSGGYTTPDGVGHTFKATVEDLGAPGEGADKFSIALSDGYARSGTLSRGEIDIII